MNANATFEKTNNNVVVNCNATRYKNGYEFQITHQKQTFTLYVENDLFVINVHGRNVKIDVEYHLHNAYISIKHNRVTLGRINFPAPENWFNETCAVCWYNIKYRQYKVKVL